MTQYLMEHTPSLINLYPEPLRNYLIWAQVMCTASNYQINHRQNFQKAVLFLHEDDYYILFEKKQRGITPGQFAAWYLKEELIGSAVIAH